MLGYVPGILQFRDISRLRFSVGVSARVRVMVKVSD